MRTTTRTCICAAALMLMAWTPARAAPFFQAGVQGGADADMFSTPCALPGKFSEGYATFPLDAFQSYAEGHATAFNPCNALSGSPLSFASANLATGKLRAYALTQIGEGNKQQDASARAYFGDEVTLFFNGQQVSALATGLVGEIRLDIHGTRSAELLSAEAELVVDDALGHTIGDVEFEDLQGGESLVVHFTTPFSFYADLSVDAEYGQWADFGSTGTISISLPPGYSFGSASGLLLSPVPEPGTWALMFAGLGWVGWARRKKVRAA